MRSTKNNLRPAVRLLFAGGTLCVLFGLLVMAAGSPAQAASGNGTPDSPLQALGRLLGNQDVPAVWFDSDHTAICQYTPWVCSSEADSLTLSENRKSKTPRPTRTKEGDQTPQVTETDGAFETDTPMPTETATQEEPGQEDTFTPTPPGDETATVTVTEEQPQESETPTPETSTPETPAPETPTSETPAPETPTSETPAPSETVTPSLTSSPTATEEEPGQEDTFTPTSPPPPPPTATNTEPPPPPPTATFTVPPPPPPTETFTPTATEEEPQEEPTFTSTSPPPPPPTATNTQPPALPTLTFTPSPTVTQPPTNTPTNTLVPTQTLTATVTLTNTLTPLPNLSLDSVCGYASENQQVWQITNNNPFPVDFMWQATVTGETGSASVPANSLMYLTVMGPPQNLRIYVGGVLVLERAPNPPCLVYLELGVACTDDNQLAWMVFNENDFAVNVSWNLDGQPGGSGSLNANSAALVTISPISVRTLNLTFEYVPLGPRTVSLTTDITTCVFTSTPTLSPTVTATLAPPTATPTFTPTNTQVFTATPTQTAPPQTVQEPTFTPTPSLTVTTAMTETALLPETGGGQGPTATVLSTLPPPVITSTPILIPVTGADLTPAGNLALLGRVIFNVGLLILGAALLVAAALYRLR